MPWLFEWQGDGQGLVGAYRPSGQFRAVTGTAPLGTCQAGSLQRAGGPVHAGALWRSRMHPLSCESLGTLVGVTRLGS